MARRTYGMAAQLLQRDRLRVEMFDRFVETDHVTLRGKFSGNALDVTYTFCTAGVTETCYNGPHITTRLLGSVPGKS